MHKKIIILVICLSILVGIMLLSSPKNLPLLVLPVVPLLMGFSTGLATSIGLSFIKKIHDEHILRSLLPLGVGLATVLFVVMSSLGQLTFGTGLVLLAFVFLLSFYLIKFGK